MSDRLVWMDALLGTPNDAERGGIDVYARAVAFVLYRHMNPAGQARPGMRTLTAQAAVSPAVAVDRVKVLEAAGWLVVERRAGAGSRYQAVVPEGALNTPTVSPRETVTVSPDETPTVSPREAVDPATVSSEPETVSPGETEPQEPLTPSSSNSSTHDGSTPGARQQTRAPRRQPITRWNRRDWSAQIPPVERITGDLIFDAMAARTLMLDRQSGREGLPPAGSYRETRFLETLADDKRATYQEQAKQIRADYPDLCDPEVFIWRLDPSLALGGDPVLRWHTEQVEAEARARAEAEAAMTEEDRQRDQAAARRCLAEMRAAMAARQEAADRSEPGQIPS